MHIDKDTLSWEDRGPGTAATVEDERWQVVLTHAPIIGDDRPYGWVLLDAESHRPAGRSGYRTSGRCRTLDIAIESAEDSVVRWDRLSSRTTPPRNQKG